MRCVTYLASRNLKFPTDLWKICSSLNPHTADSFKEATDCDVLPIYPKFCKLYYGISSLDVVVSSDGQQSIVFRSLFHIRTVTLGVKIMEVWHRHLSILWRNKTYRRIRSRCAKQVGALCAHRNSLILNKGSKPNVQTASQYGPTNHWLVGQRGQVSSNAWQERRRCENRKQNKTVGGHSLRSPPPLPPVGHLSRSSKEKASE